MLRNLKVTHNQFQCKSHQSYSQDVKDEVKRLKKNLLSPLPMFACPDNYISIALLNVRSAVAKLPESDIERDHSLTSASILCFTETWLTPQLSSPVSLGYHQVLRSTVCLVITKKFSSVFQQTYKHLIKLSSHTVVL